MQKDGLQAEWVLALVSQSVALCKIAHTSGYLVTVLADRGLGTLILCQSRDGSGEGSLVGMSELLMFCVYITRERSGGSSFLRSLFKTWSLDFARNPV